MNVLEILRIVGRIAWNHPSPTLFATLTLFLLWRLFSPHGSFPEERNEKPR